MIHQELGEREREREREEEEENSVPSFHSIILSFSREGTVCFHSAILSAGASTLSCFLSSSFFSCFFLFNSVTDFFRKKKKKDGEKEKIERERRERSVDEREREGERRERRERERERSVRLISEKLCAEPAAFTALAQQSEQTSKRRRRRRRRPRDPALVLSHPHTTLPFFRDRREESFARPLLLRERTRLLFPRHRRLPRATREAFFPAQEEPAEHP